MPSTPDEIHHEIHSRSYDLFGGVLLFNEWCGLRYGRSEPDGARIEMPFSPRIADAAGAISPGMMATLADSVGGQVAVARLGWRAQVATISLQLSLLAPMPPGVGLIGEGRVVAADAGTVLTDIRMITDDADTRLVATARLRLIMVRQVEAPTGATPYPPVTIPATGAFLGPDDFSVAIDGPRAEGRLARRSHYMGNAARAALHGGLVAAALFETLSHLGRQWAPAFRPLDGVVDFLRPARDAALLVRAEMGHAGSRIGFASAVLEQEHPGAGPATVARFTATLTR